MLSSLFNPRSVAVIGASSREMHIGNRIISNLLHFGYDGDIYPINPKAEKICGIKAYKSILDVSKEIDVAHVVIPARFVSNAIEDCGIKGVKNVIINTGGFSEIGVEGLKIQDEFMCIAKKYGIRVLGPNCQGIINSDKNIRAYCNFTFSFPKNGNISILALSGGVGEAIHQAFVHEGVGTRIYVSSGNECDISTSELVKYLGNDKFTKVIVIYLEGLKNPKEFIKEVRKISFKKPILGMRSARTVAGAKAAASHTGSLVGEDIFTELSFKKSGIIDFTREDVMINSAIILGSQPIPKGNRVGIITNTGGPAVIATDVLVESGFVIPELSIDNVKILKSKLFKEASINNPVDVLATGTSEHYKCCLEVMLNDSNVDIIFIIFVTPFFVDTEKIAKEIALISHKQIKTIVCNFITDREKWITTEKLLKEGGVPCFSLPSNAAHALLACNRYRKVKDIRNGIVKIFNDIDTNLILEIIKSAETKGQKYLKSEQVYKILNACKIVVPKWRVTKTLKETLKAANDVGYPIVLKIDSEVIIHKSDLGGVVLNISNEIELREALLMFLSKFGKDDKELSFLVQKYLPGEFELIVGAKAVPKLGHVVMFGLGGIFVEILKDVVFRLAPVNDIEAINMISSIKNKKILSGVRGKKSVNIELLVELIQRLSQLVSNFPQIKELDFNPVMVLEDKVSVLDARIILKN